MGFRGGFTYSSEIQSGNTMSDPGRILDPDEQFLQGVGKAHRQVNFSHYDYRNFSRGAALSSATITRK